MLSLQQDVDLVVLTSSITQEDIKAALCAADPDFYTMAAKTPGATYRVLWYRFSYYRSCKVDILLPGVMSIPVVPKPLIELLEGLPAMPLAGVLLLKLQAWEDHRAAVKAFMYLKQHVDASDIKQLLATARRRRIRPAQEDWLPADFLHEARRRVKLFIVSYPDTSNDWRKINIVQD
jgi:hypothetical protein